MIAGLFIAPSDVGSEIKSIANIVIKSRGGKSVIREFLIYYNREELKLI